MRNRKLAVFFLSFLVGACAEGQTAWPSEDQFLDMIEKYYEAEKTKDWEYIYECRPESFKQTVPFEVFSKYMEDGSAYWSNESVEAKRIEFHNDYAEVLIYFVDSMFGKSVEEQSGQEKVFIRSEEITIWDMAIDGSIICTQPGVRNFILMNKMPS